MLIHAANKIFGHPCFLPPELPKNAIYWSPKDKKQTTIKHDDDWVLCLFEN
jgi:hypothetical protein